ncbi:hypothetical protein B0H11DRAFT_2195261 [Mycena galericulata]|nr:hypothetical protein B0H11DRAFT_2195261 [Mycena galericulata]
MIDFMYLTLILCLVASNLGRLLRMLGWIHEYFLRARDPELVPYFDQEGSLIGMVRMPSGSRRLPHDWKANGSALEVSENDHENKAPPRSGTTDLKNTWEAPVAAPSIWDYWPNGKFQQLYSVQELMDTYDLATNWVLETVRNRGSTRALKWEKGKETRRRCLGVISCHNTTCAMQLAPAARAIDRHRQLQQTCIICGETLAVQPCGIESSLFRFRDGGFLKHGGTHNHTKFTHSAVHCPDGSIAFVDYMPKYVLLVKNASTLNEAESSPSPSHASDDVYGDSEWEGVAAEVHDKRAGSTFIPLDEADEWEMRQDPDADESEVDEIESD